MSNFKNFLTAFFLGTSLSVVAQKYELGKVTVAELQETAHPADPSAEAAYLFKNGEVRFEFSQSEGFIMKTEVMVKIKIYSKEGYRWANHMVPYYAYGNSKESISFSVVCTYNLVDGKVVKTKMKGDGEFDEKVNKYWSRKKITLPNIKEGSIIEYSYTITSPNIGKLVDWDFQTSIPVNYSKFATYVPEYFVYNAQRKGFIFPKTTVVKVDKSMNYRYREDIGQSGSVVNSASNEKLNFVETQTTYIATNLPAMHEEAFVNNMENYTSSIAHELSYTNFPNNPIKTYSTDWESVAKTIYENDDFGQELKKTGYFEAEISALTTGMTNRDEIIYAIFNYVKSNVKWNGFYDYFCHDGVKHAYKNKVGNVAEINLMLTAMLRYAGLSANPLLVSTRANGIALFPNRTAFNSVISAVEIENGLILLDATDRYASPNILPIRDLNWYGRIIRPGGSSAQVNLMPTSTSKNFHNISCAVLADGTVEGKVRNQLTDYEALEYRTEKMQQAKDTYVEAMENKYGAIEVSEYVRENEQDLSKPIIESFSFKDRNNVEIINNKLYLSPLLFFTMQENPFKLDKREYPIDFAYPFLHRFIINIDIPAGYTVESIPQGANMITGDDIGAFKYLVNVGENKIQLSITFEIKTPIVGAEYYEVIKDFYQKVMEKEKEKIVLAKI